MISSTAVEYGCQGNVYIRVVMHTTAIGLCHTRESGQVLSQTITYDFSLLYSKMITDSMKHSPQMEEENCVGKTFQLSSICEHNTGIIAWELIRSIIFTWPT